MFSDKAKATRILGIDVKIDASWLLIAALITWSLSDQVFPHMLLGLSGGSYLAMAFVTMLGFFASLLVHELAHALVAGRHGVRVGGVTLFLFGGVPERLGTPRRAAVELRIALAGPLASLVLAGGFWALGQAALGLWGAGPWVSVLFYLALANLILALFNLMPALPLDGGRVLRAILWRRSGDLLRATEIATRLGAGLAYGLMAAGVLALFQGALVIGLWLILIGGFVLWAGRGTYQAQLVKERLGGRRVADLMSHPAVTVSPDVTLETLVHDIMLPQQVRYLPVVEDGVFLGHVDAGMLRRIDRENWTGVTVGDVFAGREATETATPDEPIPTLFHRIASGPARKFIVLDGAHPVGVIALSDLTRSLSLIGELRG